MANDILQQLLSSSSSKGADAQLLESLGRKAANQFLKDGTTLNGAIASLASEHPQLQNEHVKRIAEFANNAVFQDMHSKSEDKNVHFDVADPGTIIQDLKDGGSPAHDGKTMNDNTDYADKPDSNPDSAKFENAFREHAETQPDSEEAKLGADCRRPGEPRPKRRKRQGDAGRPRPPRPPRSKFDTKKDTKEKTASITENHQLHANPIDDAYDAHIRLRATREKVAEAHEQFDMILKQAEEDFYQTAKSEVLDPDGFGIRGVVAATEQAAPTDGVAFQALQKVALRLVKEGAISGKDLEKSASAGSTKVVNSQHPLVVTFSGLVKAAAEKVRARAALNEVDQGLGQTDSFLRSLR